jgi:hypothetical protein
MSKLDTTADAPQTAAPESDRPAERDISVAVMFPGGRVDRMTTPLDTTAMDVAVEPADAYERDIVLLDNAGPMIWKAYLRGYHADAKLIYRIRGDMLRAYREMNLTPLKYHAAKLAIGKVDGAVSIEEVLAERFARTTGVSPIGLASLCKAPEAWPDVTHSDETIRAVTLTNANYMGKVQPLIEYAPVVNRFLATHGGCWTIYGRGNKATYLAQNLADYEHVEFAGYTDDPQAALGAHNLMLHLSSFDSMPNAILEGMASRLPVVTNPYCVFAAYGEPLEVTPMDELGELLTRAQDPGWRADRGEAGVRTIEQDHSPVAVGQQYVSFFQELLA